MIDDNLVNKPDLSLGKAHPDSRRSPLTNRHIHLQRKLYSRLLSFPVSGWERNVRGSASRSRSDCAAVSPSPLCKVTITESDLLNSQGERKIVNPPESLSNKNLKHITKHLPAFQQYDVNLTLDDIVKLGQEIATRKLNRNSRRTASFRAGCSVLRTDCQSQSCS
ncbi:MAG: hypothetical protein EBE86_014115 [Hormoscilla sp. GUM202]|nr:hypothetical protein [Hormoscilla sp. GUM202]